MQGLCLSKTLEKRHWAARCHTVTVTPEPWSGSRLGPRHHLAALRMLKSLPSFFTGAGFEVLPSLESLHVEASRAVCPLASASVRHLSLEGTCGCRMSEYPTIGDLLQLRSISLKLVPDMRV